MPPTAIPVQACSRIRAKPKVIFRPKQAALVKDKCKETEEIGLTKPVHHTKRTVPKVPDNASCRCSNLGAPSQKIPVLGGQP
ncbi:hypothetical protein ACTXT7_001894 [Hymenolepis weldensis]